MDEGRTGRGNERVSNESRTNEQSSNQASKQEAETRGKEAYLENARRVMDMFVQNTVSDPCLHDLDGCLHVALCIMKATILDITESPGVVMLHVRKPMHSCQLFKQDC